jgi:MFS superfamily sulfate permease-like transporter
MATLGIVDKDRAKTVILRLDQVPAMDATGLVALESVLAQLRKRGCMAVIVGCSRSPNASVTNAHIEDVPGQLLLRPDLASALRDTGHGEPVAPPASPAASEVRLEAA